MSSKDSVVPFVFDALAVRGAVVQLEGAWSRIQQEHGYPRPVKCAWSLSRSDVPDRTKPEI